MEVLRRLRRGHDAGLHGLPLGLLGLLGALEMLAMDHGWHPMAAAQRHGLEPKQGRRHDWAAGQDGRADTDTVTATDGQTSQIP